MRSFSYFGTRQIITVPKVSASRQSIVLGLDCYFILITDRFAIWPTVPRYPTRAKYSCIVFPIIEKKITKRRFAANRAFEAILCM